MAFEFDPAKSRANKRKHGIDFIEAQALFRDSMAIYLDVMSAPEERYVIIGKIENKHWSAVATYRNKNVRLISVRRSRKKEIEIYEKNQNH